jgi:hypothetical protein
MRRSRDGRLRIAAVLALLVVDTSAVWADCRGEVDVAFQKLETPGRQYRRETIAVSRPVDEHPGNSVPLTFRETTEFIRPDRIRKIFDYGEGVASEAIQVDKRTWMRRTASGLS